MAKHDQKGDGDSFVCTNCSYGVCEKCVDVLRMMYTTDTICRCRRKNHSGEPNDQQILDPTDGSVHTPGLIITEDGKVIRK